MIVTGITPMDFAEVIAKLNETTYQGNLTAEIGKVHSAHRFGARVVPLDSGAKGGWGNLGDIAYNASAPGARRSATGRRLKAACWHAYRDVLAAVFDLNPEAKVYTAMAKYIGRDGFYVQYPKTAHTNIGSMAVPAYMPELCDCEHYGISTHEQG